MSGLTNRHLCALGQLAATPAAARSWPEIVEDMVRRGLVERCGDGDGARPTEAGVKILARWLGRPAVVVPVDGLTPRMADALRVISAATTRGVSPSYQEIGAALGVTKSGVHRLVLSLEARGKLGRLPGRKRSLAPTVPV